MPTFTLRVPASCTVTLDGANEVNVAIVGDEVTLTVTTPVPAVRVTPPPVRRPAPAPIPEWDGPVACKWVPAEYFQHDPSEDSGPIGSMPVGPWDPESETNDPWLRGR